MGLSDFRLGLPKLSAPEIFSFHKIRCFTLITRLILLHLISCSPLSSGAFWQLFDFNFTITVKQSTKNSVVGNNTLDPITILSFKCPGRLYWVFCLGSHKTEVDVMAGLGCALPWKFQERIQLPPLFTMNECSSQPLGRPSVTLTSLVKCSLTLSMDDLCSQQHTSETVHAQTVKDRDPTLLVLVSDALEEATVATAAEAGPPKQDDGDGERWQDLRVNFMPDMEERRQERKFIAGNLTRRLTQGSVSDANSKPMASHAISS